MNQVLRSFYIVQIADLMTTLIFLSIGVQEANPIIKTLMHNTSPLVGLLFVKSAALMLAMYCISSGRLRLLRRINIAFVFLVVWNVMAMVLQVGEIA